MTEQPFDPNEEIKRGQAFIDDVHKKMTQLAQEFALGEINRTQFQHLYNRYQRQIMTVSQLIAESDPSVWRDAVQDESFDTLMIKRSLAAKIDGFSLYNNTSQMPIETEGEFSISAELIVPMLSSYRSATAEIFHSQMRSSQLENGRWLYFMGGQHTTLIILFSLEPAANQLATLQQIHKDYEIANEATLKLGRAGVVIALPFFALIRRTNLISDTLKASYPTDTDTP